MIFNPSMDRVTILPQSQTLLTWMTVIRDRTTETTLFATTVDKVARQLMAAALDFVPHAPLVVETQTAQSYRGLRPSQSVCGVSILRAGASLERSLRETWGQPLLFGHFLIQRDEKTSLPTLLYSKLPKGITDCVVLVLEPMLATGGSACMAISALIDEGVPEENIVFVNVLASRHGLDVVKKRFPKLAVVTAAVDEQLTPNNFISPGLGDFGDRYFGTIG